MRHRAYVAGEGKSCVERKANEDRVIQIMPGDVADDDSKSAGHYVSKSKQ